MRNKLIENLANQWRNAETYFIETENDCKKWAVLDKQESYNLTYEEEGELNSILGSMGV